MYWCFNVYFIGNVVLYLYVYDSIVWSWWEFTLRSLFMFVCNVTSTYEICTSLFVGSVRCVLESGSWMFVPVRCVFWPLLLFAGVLLASLRSELVSVFNNTYADSTKACYRTHLKSYSAFCRVIGVPMIPAQPQYVSLYCVLLARSLQYNSIKQYLNIISLLHKSLDLPSPLTSFMVVCTLRGIKNTIGQTPSFKLPVTPSMLYAMLDRLDLSELKWSMRVNGCAVCACFLPYRGKVTLLAVIRSCEVRYHSIMMQFRLWWSPLKHATRTLTHPAQYLYHV